MAILALITTPLILSLISKAKASANKRSVDAYGKAVEIAVMNHLLSTGKEPKNLKNLEIEYTGKEVSCNVMILNEGGSVYLSECTVGGTDVKDSSTEDGYYHYGKNTGTNDNPPEDPTDEPIAPEETVQTAYSIGDTVTYNGINFYVIENSGETKDSVTLLKAEPLTVDEVNTYGAGHVNNYTYSSRGTAYDYNGYGGMAYYSSDDCGYFRSEEYEGWITDGCTNNYDSSDVSSVVYNWSITKITKTDLKEDRLGYKTRLITYEELTELLGCGGENCVNSTYSWVYDTEYDYFTMSTTDYSNVWWVGAGGYLQDNGDGFICESGAVVRPVITLYKSAL